MRTHHPHRDFVVSPLNRVHVFDSLAPRKRRKTFKQRYQVFCVKYSWPLYSVDEMEIDPFDNARTVYFACMDDSEQKVLATARLIPTQFGHYKWTMIEEGWPHAVNGSVPHGPNIWEGSRICTAPELALHPELRQHVVNMLVLAIMEFALRVGITCIISSMHPKIWDSVFLARGWELERLGDEVDLGSCSGPVLTLVGCLHVEKGVYQTLKELAGLHESVLKALLDWEMYSGKLLCAENLGQFERNIHDACSSQLRQYPHLIDDAVQETKIKAARKIRQGEIVEKPPAWLATIARRTAINMRDRNKGRWDVPLDNLFNVADPDAELLGQLEARDAVERLESEVSPEDRQFIRLLDEGYTKKNAAEELGYEQHWASRRCKRYRRILRKL